MRMKAFSSLPTDSPFFALMFRFRAIISSRFRSSNGSNWSAMKIV
jgi:hypothetical protein